MNNEMIFSRRQRFRLLFKRLLLLLAGGILILVIWQHALLSYGFSQARGQLRVLLGTRPIAEVMQDPTFPDSLKAKLRLIQEIRRYAVDSLGINDTKNYTSLFDQKGKPILWVVTASKPYRLEAKEWKFPILGAFSYKGFFDYARCQHEEQQLKAKGYDTEINEVSAWSTLGWFRDPILSSMLERSEGSLANLIIHELTHATLFVKDQVTYNENLADFVGDYGAIRFLTFKYGNNSPQIRRYLSRKKYLDTYYRHVLRGAQKLDSLYATFETISQKPEKDRLKTKLIGEIMETMDTLTPALPKSKAVKDTLLPNNAFFVGYKTYREKQNIFEEEFKTKFQKNFKQYLTYLKKTYPSL